MVITTSIIRKSSELNGQYSVYIYSYFCRITGRYLCILLSLLKHLHVLPTWEFTSSFKWQPDTDRFLRVSTLAEKAPSWNSQQLLSGLELFRKMPKHIKITVIDIQNYHSFIVSPPKKTWIGEANHKFSRNTPHRNINRQKLWELLWNYELYIYIYINIPLYSMISYNLWNYLQTQRTPKTVTPHLASCFGSMA